MEVTAVTFFSYRVAPSVLIVQILTVSPEMIGWGVFHQEFHARISCLNGPKDRHQIREVFKIEFPTGLIRRGRGSPMAFLKKTNQRASTPSSYSLRLFYNVISMMSGAQLLCNAKFFHFHALLRHSRFAFLLHICILIFPDLHLLCDICIFLFPIAFSFYVVEIFNELVLHFCIFISFSFCLDTKSS